MEVVGGPGWQRDAVACGEPVPQRGFQRALDVQVQLTFRHPPDEVLHGEERKRERAPHNAVRGPSVSASCYFLPTLIFMDVPLAETTRIVVPVAGSFTPALGCSAYQNFLVSSNTGTAFWPRM